MPQQESVSSAVPSSAKTVIIVHRACAPSALPASACLMGSAQPVLPTVRSATPLLSASSVLTDTTWPSTEAALLVRVHVPVVSTLMSAKVARMAHTSMLRQVCAQPVLQTALNVQVNQYVILAPRVMT